MLAKRLGFLTTVALATTVTSAGPWQHRVRIVPHVLTTQGSLLAPRLDRPSRIRTTNQISCCAHPRPGPQLTPEDYSRMPEENSWISRRVS